MNGSLTSKNIDDQNLLVFSEDRGIATLTLNRPNQYNCLSEKLLSELTKKLEEISKNEKIRVIILQANGPAFCAGHDLKEMRANPSKAYYKKLFIKCSHFMTLITKIPQPVIAKVHGVAAAAGCQLVASCDLAIGSENASFATTGVNLALFCSTPSVAVSRNLPRKKAAEILFTGDMMQASEAADFGLINRFVPDDKLDEETLLLAKKIAAKPKIAISTGKKMLYPQLEMKLEAAYEYAAEIMACNMMDKDTIEGIDAFINKRQPNW